mmetsp:Transcript_9256/g.15012  ORF Transcript_9256/g.15012 Transcript_9256/m.15012 type:complete len:353 (-) Transcript_9256:119-1177(-)
MSTTESSTVFLVIATCLILAAIIVLHEYCKNRVWWSGFLQTAFVYMGHQFLSYRKEKKIASDGEEYIIWWPKLKRMHANKGKHKHLWIVIPGAMKQWSECIEIMERKFGAFDGSDWCVFNQPGITEGNIMKNKPVPSPTDTSYLFHFIQSMHSQHPQYEKVSLIGCSMGALSALFVVDKLAAFERKKYVQQIVMVHSPEFIRETFESLFANWLFRFDILCAKHVYNINQQSLSWSKFNLASKMKTRWWNGWPFMKEITEHVIGSKWHQLERTHYDPHRLLKQHGNGRDGKIACCDVKRIIAKNDPIVPFKSIDRAYWKYYAEVVVLERGGHCVADKLLATHIARWNRQILDE